MYFLPIITTFLGFLLVKNCWHKYEAEYIAYIAVINSNGANVLPDGSYT